jgi:hypothetical protein
VSVAMADQLQITHLAPDAFPNDKRRLEIRPSHTCALYTAD